jgi:hypothetical protein
MINIFLTTAIIDNSNKPNSHNDQCKSLSMGKRIEEYIECFNIIKSFGYNFTIVETVLDSFPLFEEYSNVIYTNVNNNSYRNRGSNYVNAFRKALDCYNFDDDDIIIHITGRYPLVDDSFLKMCENLSSEFDGCFAVDNFNQCYLFLYALRYKKLKSILDSIDVNQLENSNMCLEKIFFEYIKNYNILFTKRLGIIGRQSNSSPNSYGNTIF